MGYCLSRLILKLFCKIIFRIKGRGQENIPKSGSFILASNHVSYLDPVVLGVAATRKLTYMARDDLFSNPYLGWWLSLVGVLSIKRDSADFSALRSAMRCLREGKAIALFPEGRRRMPQEKNLSPQPGIGFLAKKSGSLVIPAYIKGTDEALPKGASSIRMKKVSVTFGKPVEIERLSDYQAVAEKIMTSINELSA
jgi:1-acyl-sn-glycerol-3-phosphate acyltransferase